MAPFHLHKGMLDRRTRPWRGGQGRQGGAHHPQDECADRRAAGPRAGPGLAAGVQIDLIVRGACILPAGVPGYTDNVHVRSVIGRLLEHSRVFYFRGRRRRRSCGCPAPTG
jgi:polyphosphate kinase